jgi:hypothetical protein
LFTEEARKKRALRKKEAEAKKAARRVPDPELRATCVRSQDVRRRAEELGYDMKMAPTVEIAARIHEEVKVLMKIAKISKNLKGGFRKKLWTAASILIAANQALSLRMQRAEGDTPQGVDDTSALRYEVSRLKRKNEVRGE